MPPFRTSATPLAPSAQTVAEAGRLARSARIERTDDGRVVISEQGTGAVAWVAADLACLCHPGDDPCAHQLIAARALGHPVQLADTPRADSARLTLALSDQLRARAPRAAHALALDLPVASDTGRRLTDPRQDSASLARELDRETALQRFTLDHQLLQLSAATRPGPLRDRLWERWFGDSQAQAYIDPETSGALVLRRLLVSEPGETLVGRLESILPDALTLLERALADDPAVAHALAVALPRPRLAQLLASLRPRPSRLALARALGARTPPAPRSTLR